MRTPLFILLFLTVSVLSFNQSFYNPYSTQPSKRSTSSRSSLFEEPTTTSPSVRYQNGYQKSNGTYVQGHYKTESNSTNLDNFSTQGNSNPFTSESGSRARDNSPNANNYGQGRTIHTGPRGGQYYYNDNGNKVYVPKQSTTFPF